MVNEKRLIDANAILQKIQLERNGYLQTSELTFTGLTIAKKIIEDAPTVDAVEVVRCKDCKHWDNWGFGGGGCEREYEADGVSKRWLDSDFCPYGEK